MALPITKVRTSHALSIQAGGQTIGLINSWNPTQSRTLTPIYEEQFHDQSYGFRPNRGCHEAIKEV